MYISTHQARCRCFCCICVLQLALTLLRDMCCCSLHGYDLAGALFAFYVQHYEALFVVA
jgi:hypothetical protein